MSRACPSPGSSPRGTAPATSERGFTLLELMAVVLIMGAVLLLVPASLDNLGAQGKLKNTANSLVAAVNGARERAILDAFEVHLEIGMFRDADEEWRYGWRYKFTNVPPPDVASGEDVDESDRQAMREQRAREREWLFSTWHECPNGIELSGISERKGTWNRVNQGSKPYSVRFFADGTVEHGLAVRIVNEDMEVDRQFKTITVVVNSLTSEPSWLEGEMELPESLPSSNFGN